MKETPGRNSMRAQFIIAAACLAHALVLQLHGDNVQPLTLEFRIAPDAVLVGSTNRFQAFISGGRPPYNCEWYCDSPDPLLTNFGYATVHELSYIAPDDPKQAVICFGVTDSNSHSKDAFKEFWQVRITLKRDGTEIPHAPPEVWAGEPMSLAAEICPSELDSRTKQWLLPGTPIKGYDPGPCQDVNEECLVKELQDEDTNKTSIDYYWINGEVDPSSRHVTFQLSVVSTTLNKTASFKVAIPDYPYNPEVKSETAIACDRSYSSNTDSDPQYSAHYGRVGRTCGDDKWAFFHDWFYDGEGSLRLMQTVVDSATCKIRFSLDSTLNISGYDGDDMNAPYSHGDSPGYILPSRAYNIWNDAYFKTYIMFKAPKTNSIWVPIRMHAWHWKCRYYLDAGGWACSYRLANSDLGQTENLYPPQWSEKYPSQPIF